jgi:hypothetical protein
MFRMVFGEPAEAGAIPVVDNFQAISFSLHQPVALVGFLVRAQVFECFRQVEPDGSISVHDPLETGRQHLHPMLGCVLEFRVEGDRSAATQTEPLAQQFECKFLNLPGNFICTQSGPG